MLGKLFAKLWSSAPKPLKEPGGPPPLPFRCGTILMEIAPEKRSAIVERWRQSEAEYVKWVSSHPDADPEWIETAERLKIVHARERE
jgi:hypothetical protein